ncbi:MAG: hypothetical protein J2P48_21855 [Alphaproteobacteria bacterium]|nr:hypothetical protein [Alphaproteobacteria bacterium]
MEIDAAIFFTDYSMKPTALGGGAGERGFDSPWVADVSRSPAALACRAASNT